MHPGLEAAISSTGWSVCCFSASVWSADSMNGKLSMYLSHSLRDKSMLIKPTSNRSDPNKIQGQAKVSSNNMPPQAYMLMLSLMRCNKAANWRLEVVSDFCWIVSWYRSTYCFTSVAKSNFDPNKAAFFDISALCRSSIDR